MQELVRVFNFHRFDNLRDLARKIDPRREPHEVKDQDPGFESARIQIVFSILGSGSRFFL